MTALDKLLASFPPSVVRTDRESLFAASFDNIKLSFPPEAVVFPRDEDDVAALLKLANEYGVPVTVRGAGTSTVGGATPVCGGWVLSLAHWQKLEIDPVSGTASVQPGVITEEISKAAAAFGLFYPPDPASKKYCTIGGNIATNAGGLRAAKYGVTRDYVLALEGVLPTGEKVRWGANVKKFVSGYNFKDLWVGSEGTLGVVTKAVLKLQPLPEARHSFLCAFDSDSRALAAATKILGSHLQPSVLEFMDSLSVACAQKFKGTQFFENCEAPAVLLIEADGTRADVAAQAEQLRKWATEETQIFKETDDPETAETFWELRRACSPAMFMLAPAKLNEDIVVPAKNLLKLLDLMRQVNKDTGLYTPVFGHVGDGNLHVHVMFDRDQKSQRQKAGNAVHKIMKGVVALEGCITGEHGIGLAKTPFLALQHSPAEIAAMRAVKNALDPKNILGRGKIFDVFDVWEKEPVSVKLPWEHR
ncbi:MAG: FAD-binding protein [Opitutales bacterium]|nr:FAD-binding protein [Opitutales bacterium]